MNIGDIVKGRCFGQYKKLRIKNIEDLGVMGKCYICEDSKGNIFQYYSSQVGTLLLPWNNLFIITGGIEKLWKNIK